MPPNKTNIERTVEQATLLIDSEPDLSPALKAVVLLLMEFLVTLSGQKALNSRNSSTPPSQDPNRVKTKRSNRKRKPGGQPGHVGTTLQPFEDPDDIKQLSVDRCRYRQHGAGTVVGYDTRQVVDIEFYRYVTEYRAEVIEFEDGTRVVADFPEEITHRVQYGNSVKAHATYLSQFQLLPYARLADYFAQQLDIPVSQGTLVNFNNQAFEALANYERIARQKLIDSAVMNVDETGVNVGGKGHWLHVCATPLWTLYAVHEKRGALAFEHMDVIPKYQGILCHDHWKPYYAACTVAVHSLCNSHHLRELTFAHEHDAQHWAAKLRQFLLDLNQQVIEAEGALTKEEQTKAIARYRRILKQAQSECPPPDESLRPPGKRGRMKRSKSRNLLERLISFEDDVLRFMTAVSVPFTNNLAENDLRMTKVQQKISGCFRSFHGAEVFCRIRGYLTTCRKHNVSYTDALNLLFQGRLPDFCK